MNYFEFYPGDYLRDTTRLSFVEHGAYLRLLLAYFGEEKSLPESYSKLYVITGAVSAADKAAIRIVADRYFPVSDDGERHNGRADAEIVKAQKRMASSRENGSKGGRPRKPSDNPAGNPLGFENPPFQKPSDNPSITQPGEALQTPDPTRKSKALLPTPDNSTAAPSAGGVVGTPAGHAAAALNRQGLRITSQNPNLIAACTEGVTTDALLEVQRQYPDKPAGYVIAAARRIHAEAATAITTGDSHAPHPRRESLVQRVTRKAIDEERSRQAIGQDDDGPVGEDGHDLRTPLVLHVR